MFRRFRNYIEKSIPLLRVISLNSVLVAVRLISGFITAKASAVFLGPQGMALLGNFRDLFQLLINLTAKNFESGIIRYTAQDSKPYPDRVLGTVSGLSLFVILIISPLLLLFSEQLSLVLFHSSTYQNVIILTACILPLIAFNIILLAILNGLKAYKTLVKIQVVGFLGNAVLIWLLAMFRGLEGALWAIVLGAIFQLGFTLLWARKDIGNVLHPVFSGMFNKALAGNLWQYFGMAVFSSLLIVGASFFVRNTIINELGTDMAGYWEALNKISLFYLMFFSSLLTFYLLPKLAENKTYSGYKAIMKSYFEVIVPILTMGLAIIYFLRIPIIKIFLTGDFIYIKELVLLQLAGDFIRVIAMSFAYQFHAKKIIRYYLISDAVLYISFCCLSVVFIKIYDLKGVYLAYIISYALYLVTVLYALFVSRKKYLQDA